MAVSAAWDLRQFRNLIVTRNAAAGLDDYTPFTIANPLDNTPLTVFRLNNNRQGQVDLVDTTATDSERARQTYQSYEVNFNARLPKGATVFGGVIMERTLSVACDVNDPNLLRFCDQTGELYQEYGAVPLAAVSQEHQDQRQPAAARTGSIWRSRSRATAAPGCARPTARCGCR